MPDSGTSGNGSSFTASLKVSHAVALFSATLKSLVSTVGTVPAFCCASLTMSLSADSFLIAPSPGLALTQHVSSTHSSRLSSSYMSGRKRSSSTSPSRMRHPYS